MKSTYIPDLIMSVIYKNHDNDIKNFVSSDNVDYSSSIEDCYFISLQELRDTLEDIFDK